MSRFRGSAASSAWRPTATDDPGTSIASTDRVLVKRTRHGRATLIPRVQRAIEEVPAHVHDSSTHRGKEAHHQLADLVYSVAVVESIAETRGRASSRGRGNEANDTFTMGSVL